LIQHEAFVFDMNFRSANIVLYMLILKFLAEGRYDSSRTSRELGIKTWVYKSRPNLTITMNADHDQDKIHQKCIIILGGEFISYYYAIDSSGRNVAWYGLFSIEGLVLGPLTKRTIRFRLWLQFQRGNWRMRSKHQDWCHKFLIYWV